jgi:hypothetical protein
MEEQPGPVDVAEPTADEPSPLPEEVIDFLIIWSD